MGQEFSLTQQNLDILYKNRLSTATITQGEWTITVSKSHTIVNKLHCLLVATKGETTKKYIFAILLNPPDDDNNKINMGNSIDNYIRGFDQSMGLSAEDIKELSKSVTKLKL